MNLKMLALCAMAASALFTGCGTLLDMSGGGANGVERRAFVNDAAPNDSLPSVIVGAGVYFVMQPGKSYRLRLRTPVSGQKLDVMRARGDFYYTWQTFSDSAEGDSVRYFTLRPEPGDSARYYRAFLRSPGGLPGARPQTVRFVPAAPIAANALRVKLVIARRISSLTDAQKNTFAQALLTELGSIYGAMNITVSGSHELFEPSAPRFVADFGGGLGDLSHVRRGDTAYVYVVDGVRYEGEENIKLLGFAPREGFSLSEDFVVLNASGEGTGSAPVTKGQRLALTAAHELGHLFGLRHTRPSAMDLKAEYDKSNTHDGFEAPENCAALPKGAGAPDAGRHTEIRVGDRVYCLRAAAEPDQYCACSDMYNLMYAYACNVDQKSMNEGQRNFLRWNISLFR